MMLMCFEDCEIVVKRYQGAYWPFFVDEYNSNEPWPIPSFSIPFPVLFGNFTLWQSCQAMAFSGNPDPVMTHAALTAFSRLSRWGLVGHDRKCVGCTNDKLQNGSKWLRTIWRICWFFVGSRLSTSLLFFHNKCTMQLHACSVVLWVLLKVRTMAIPKRLFRQCSGAFGWSWSNN